MSRVAHLVRPGFLRLGVSGFLPRCWRLAPGRRGRRGDGAQRRSV